MQIRISRTHQLELEREKLLLIQIDIRNHYLFYLLREKIINIDKI